ncbi:MAG: transposase, partial [Chlamydiales bacterium]
MEIQSCDIGTKKNSKGHVEHWIGYKLHLDIADGCVPISAILTSASLNDSQAAIPLAEMTVRRVINLYDLMDAAYDAPGIIAHSKSLGHVPLIDKNPRRDKALAEELKAESKRQKLLNLELAEKSRYNERTTAERANA